MRSITACLSAILLSLFMLLPGSCEDQGENGIKKGDIQELLDQRIPGWMERYDVPGVSIALVSSGELTWSNGYGFADLEKQTRMRSETVCRVESISKSVTARGVMKLVERGEIGLDDPVAYHLKSWDFPETNIDVERVTIRHLLSHSSGLPLGTIGLEYAPDEERPTLRESLSREVWFERDPGTKFNYSNVGFHLLELLIEDVTGRNFSEYMQEEILDPLKMEHSSYEWSEDFITPVPNGHNLNGKPIPVYVYSEKGAGGLFANAEDIARFVASGMFNPFYSENNVLTENSIRELYTPVTNVAGIYAFVSELYGLGHFIETLPNGQTAVFSGGQGNGWMTHFHLIPETGDGIVILTNSSRSWPLISHILSEWAEWNGLGSVGMGIITKAITWLWVVIGLITAGSFYQIIRIIRGSIQGKRTFDLQIKNYLGVQFLQLVLSVILLSVLIWSATQEYLMITSVFPGASDWFILSLWFLAFVLLISVLLSKESGLINSLTSTEDI
jgi:CubicO group peptidase (beta-lactamase class C family)